MTDLLKRAAPTTFTFEPLPPLENPIHFPHQGIAHPLGYLASLPGTWKGKGFNVIWRPFHPDASQPASQDHFLELNVTDDEIDFTAISGPIPNRGLLQSDINMFGLTYLQQISDANVGGGLHIEPGIWCSVPKTQDPSEAESVVRMASIPHGTTVLAQGAAFTVAGPPKIDPVSITPFVIGNPAKTIPFAESNLSVPTAFRSPAPQLAGVTQTMVDNPNSVLTAAIASQTITSTTVLTVSSKPALPLTGGGTDNTAFLRGTPSPTSNPDFAPDANAQDALVTATFWIETVKDSPNLQLQYTQTVLLNFKGLSWPHVTVGTLTLTQADNPSIKTIDPTLPDNLVPKSPNGKN